MKTKSYRHDEGSQELPAEVPEVAGPVAGHLFHAVTEPDKYIYSIFHSFASYCFTSQVDICRIN